MRYFFNARKDFGMDSKAKPFSRRMGPGWLWLLATLLIGGISLLTSFQPLWANIPFNVAAPILVLIFLKTVFFE